MADIVLFGDSFVRRFEEYLHADRDRFLMKIHLKSGVMVLAAYLYPERISYILLTVL